MLATTLMLSASLALGMPIQDHAGHSHDGTDPFGVFLAHNSDAICTVSFILEVSGGQMDTEVPMEATGTLVSRDGMVMLSSSSMDMGNRMNNMRRGRGGRGGGGGGEGMDIEAQPVDIRVMIGSDFDEYDAQLIAKDSSLGLAFVKIDEYEAISDIQPVTFMTPDRMRVGEEVFGINRMNEGHDYAPYIGWTRISGRVEQPRLMWSVTSGYNGRGLPLFNMYGQAIGVLTNQRADAEAPRGGRGGGGRGMGMMGGGGGGGGGGVFLIPSKDINEVLERVRKKDTESEGESADNEPAMATEND